MYIVNKNNIIYCVKKWYIFKYYTVIEIKTFINIFGFAQKRFVKQLYEQEDHLKREKFFFKKNLINFLLK